MDISVEVARPSLWRALTSGATILALVGTSACKNKDVEETGNTLSSTTSVSLEINSMSDRKPDSPVRLARWLDVLTSEPATLSVTWTDGSHGGAHASSVLSDDQTLAILGLRAERNYTLTAVATNEAGQSSAPATIEMVTEALPEDFPEMEVLALDSSRREPGLTLIDISAQGGQGPYYLAAFDVDLEVVWLATMYWGDVRLTPQGTLFGNRLNGAFEMDFMGDAVNFWSGQGVEGATPIEHAFLHHEVIPRDDGGFVSLTNGVHFLADYPASYTDPLATQAGQVKAPVVVQIAANGDTVKQFDVGDVLDFHRLGYDSLSIEGGLLDWAHGNALLEHPDGGYVVSLRHQDAIVKLTSTGELEWILGDPGGWTEEFQPYLFEPIGADFSWFYHQHAPELSESGELLLFDNGNWGHTPYGPPPTAGLLTSRVVRYQLNEQDRTVQMIGSWGDFGPGSPIYCAAFGDADLLPQTQNILSVFGFGAGEEQSSNQELGFGLRTSHIIEFDPNDPTNPAMHLRLFSNLADDPGGWTTYRAEHITALVPPT